MGKWFKSDINKNSPSPRHHANKKSKLRPLYKSACEFKKTEFAIAHFMLLLLVFIALGFLSKL